MAGGIANKERNFIRFIQRHFEISLPAGVKIFYAKGVRVGTDETRTCGIDGEVGYAACDFGFNPTNAFIQNFGHLAKRNVLRLKDETEARGFATGKDLAANLGRSNKQLVITYKGQVLGLGYYDSSKKKVLNKVPEKRRREIVNNMPEG